MSVDDVLGYINQFVEHDGYKVIVIANEEKVLGKAPEFSSMKEKVIGRTFEIRPDFANALDHFLTEIGKHKAHNVLFQRQEIILKTFLASGYGNLRQLRQAVLDFTNLWDCLQPQGLSKQKDFWDRLVSDIFALSIECRAGSITMNDILKLQEVDWSSYLETEKKLDKSPSDLAFEKHGFRDGGQYALPVEAYATFFSGGHLPGEEAIQALSASPYLMNDNTASWKKLWYLTRLTDADFEELSADVLKKFNSLSYLSEGEVIHAAALMLDHSANGLLTIAPKKMLQITKNVVKELARTEKLDPGPKGSDHRRSREDLSAFGLGYTGRESELFRNFISYYRSEQQKVRAKATAKWAEDWMKSLRMDTESWAKRLVAENGDEAWFAREPILSIISARDFCEDISQLSIRELEFVRRAINSRFEYFSSNQKWKLEELPFLKETTKLLHSHIRSFGNSTLPLSKFAIKDWLLPDIKRAIDVLEKQEGVT